MCYKSKYCPLSVHFYQRFQHFLDENYKNNVYKIKHSLLQNTKLFNPRMKIFVKNVRCEIYTGILNTLQASMSDDFYFEKYQKILTWTICKNCIKQKC